MVPQRKLLIALPCENLPLLYASHSIAFHLSLPKIIGKQKEMAYYCWYGLKIIEVCYFLKNKVVNNIPTMTTKRCFFKKVTPNILGIFGIETHHFFLI